MPVIKAQERRLNGVFDESASFSPFFFIQGADTQLGMIANFDGIEKKVYPDHYKNSLITWDKEIELCEKTVEIVNKMEPQPEFFVICGDLLDAYPEDWPEYREKQNVDFQRIFANCKVPLLCVCGNHDVGNSPTPETIGMYKKTFGDDYYTFKTKGVRFIVINSQYYEDNSRCKKEAEEHEKWLDKVLEKNKTEQSQLVVFQHIPPFVQYPDEEKIYFNFEIKLRKKLLEKLYDAGVKAIFCGHYHRNAGGFYKDMELIVTSAIGCQIGSDGYGFRIVRINDEGISHNYKTIDSYDK